LNINASLYTCDLFLPSLWGSSSQTFIYIYIYTHTHVSVHSESNFITVQQGATYSVYYISVGSSTCFRGWHTSSGALSTV